MSERLPYVVKATVTDSQRYLLSMSDGTHEQHDRTTRLYDPLQVRVAEWVGITFGSHIFNDIVERTHRFGEESMELVQAMGGTAEEMHKLVDYVFGRDVGVPNQEVGGTIVTLAALCAAAGMDMHLEGEVELERIWEPAMQEKIRDKQRGKPDFGPLPTVPDDPRYGELRHHAIVIRLHNSDRDVMGFTPQVDGQFWVFTQTKGEDTIYLKAGPFSTHTRSRRFIAEDTYYENMTYLIGRGDVK